MRHATLDPDLKVREQRARALLLSRARAQVPRAPHGEVRAYLGICRAVAAEVEHVAQPQVVPPPRARALPPVRARAPNNARAHTYISTRAFRYTHACVSNSSVAPIPARPSSPQLVVHPFSPSPPQSKPRVPSPRVIDRHERATARSPHPPELPGEAQRSSAPRRLEKRLRDVAHHLCHVVPVHP